jgi:CheY-like chemotaxis protein
MKMVVLDLGLPGMDGYEVARQLRLLPGTASALLVAVSGYGGAEDQQRSLAAGFNEHFTKPVGFDQLQSLLASLLSSAS